MRKFVIMTDSCSDLASDYIEEKKIPYVSLTCSLDGTEYIDDFGRSISYKEFFDKLRSGSLPKTSQPSSQVIYNKFEELINEGNDIIYVCVSSGLSGTFNGANVAKNMILENHPEANIHIIDVMTASLGQGLMVMKAIELKEKGLDKEEIITYLEGRVQELNTYILVDDLGYLKRGGRISTAAATIGMVLHVKPILNLNHEGKVKPILKVKGRKKSIQKLFDITKERINEEGLERIAICHGDCLKEAEVLKDLLMKEVGVKEVIINYIGSAVGAYSGAEALAVFFFGRERQHHMIDV